MSIHEDEFTNAHDDWTPEERELLASLPRERIPPGDLKARTVRAVREHHDAVARTDKSPRRVIALAAAAAAAAVIFIAGTLVGYLAATRTTPSNAESQSATREAVATTEHAAPTINQLRYVVWY